MVVEDGDAPSPPPILSREEFGRVSAVSPWSFVANRNLQKYEFRFGLVVHIFTAGFESAAALPNSFGRTAGLFGSWTELLHSKASISVRFLRSALAASRGALLTHRPVAFAAVLLALLYLRRRRRLRGGEDSRERLVGMITKTDEKINNLLDQISRMNQMMIAIKKTQPKLHVD
ncbi:hypothetical protein AAHA92_01962 [Salvia divinorum]|uniref:Uncharacterized protein n=1 Tax=Salvia divinorum TaxID=28513 RepID=A0ABD1IC86_SALDI